MSSPPNSGRSSYLDLLVAVLSEHEKNMDKILEKMEKISEDLAKAVKVRKKASKSETAVIREMGISPEGGDTLIYMKVKLNRSLDEVLKILESLKE